MMKSVALVVLLSVASATNLANTSRPHNAPEYQKHLGSRIPTPTKSVLARVVPKNKRQILTPTLLDIEDPDESSSTEAVDLHVGYRRPEVIKVVEESDSQDPEVSDYVTIRLAVARARAIAAYRQKYCNSV